MADLTAVELSKNAGVALSTENAAATQTIPYERDGSIVLYVSNEDGGGHAATVTISASDEYGASGLDDIEVTVADGDVTLIQLGESQRIKNSDGDVDVAVAIAAGGTLTSVKLAMLKLDTP